MQKICLIFLVLSSVSFAKTESCVHEIPMDQWLQRFKKLDAELEKLPPPENINLIDAGANPKTMLDKVAQERLLQFSKQCKDEFRKLLGAARERALDARLKFDVSVPPKDKQEIYLAMLGTDEGLASLTRMATAQCSGTLGVEQEKDLAPHPGSPFLRFESSMRDQLGVYCEFDYLASHNSLTMPRQTMVYDSSRPLGSLMAQFASESQAAISEGYLQNFGILLEKQGLNIKRVIWLKSLLRSAKQREDITPDKLKGIEEVLALYESAAKKTEPLWGPAYSISEYVRRIDGFEHQIKFMKAMQKKDGCFRDYLFELSKEGKFRPFPLKKEWINAAYQIDPQYINYEQAPVPRDEFTTH